MTCSYAALLGKRNHSCSLDVKGCCLCREGHVQQAVGVLQMASSPEEAFHTSSECGSCRGYLG